MLALLLPTLFVAAGFLALGAIGASWRSHGEAVLALRQQLLECGRTSELRYRLVTTSPARIGEALPTARIYRMEFKPRESLGLALCGRPVLRAAA